jgi:RTX calcium-binding nonapeptide repeat (4 copies)
MSFFRPAAAVEVAALEGRLLLAAEPPSAPPVAWMDGHRLRVVGAATEDFISIRLDAEHRNVEVVWGSDLASPTHVDPFARAVVRRIDVAGGAGNDIIQALESDVPFSLPLLISGGTGSDTLKGASGRDRIRGGDGDDVIFGADGDDRLFGDDGEDVIRGDTGRDRIFGGAGNDEIDFLKSAKLPEMDPNNYALYGDFGHDRIDGGDDDDAIEITTYRNKGRDHVRKSGGHDLLVDKNPYSS